MLVLTVSLMLFASASNGANRCCFDNDVGICATTDNLELKKDTKAASEIVEVKIAPTSAISTAGNPESILAENNDNEVFWAGNQRSKTAFSSILNDETCYNFESRSNRLYLLNRAIRQCMPRVASATI